LYNQLLSKDWRINHLYKIVDKNSRLVTFREFPFQERIRKQKAKITQVLKYRQGGVTTGCSIDILDDTIFYPNTTSMILAHKRQDLPKIFDRVRLAVKTMDSVLRPVIDKGGGSRYEIRFPEINSKIYTDIENRGDTIHRLHVSEAAFVDQQKLKATLGAVVPHGKICYESTPNGMGNDFYKHWANPRSHRGKIFIPWFIQPEYIGEGSTVSTITTEESELMRLAHDKYGIVLSKDQIAWRRGTKEELKELFAQEYPEDDKTCFLASGACPVDQELISRLMNKAKEPLINDSGLMVWETYQRDKRYIISADVAEGVRSDYSVADVFRVDTKEQVAQFRSNNIKPFAFAKKITELADMYWVGGRPWPLISCELNNHGHAVNGYLYNTARYSNLYYGKEETPGWLTNSVTRPKMIDTFIEGVESETIKLNSLETLGECLTLVDNGGKIEASDGENDDTIISAAIGIQMIITNGRDDLWDNLSSKVLL